MKLEFMHFDNAAVSYGHARIHLSHPNIEVPINGASSCGIAFLCSIVR